MIRTIVLSLFISGLALYAFRDWYKSLCGLILLMAVVEHPDMPKTIMGVQGLNPWNILLAFVLFAWALSRSRDNLVWDMPRHITILFVLYLSVILISFARMMSDISSLADAHEILGMDAPQTRGLVSEHIINCLKWIIPGILLYDGCRSPQRFLLGLFVVLGVYFLLGVQVIKWMPIQSALSGEGLTARSLKILLNEVGYHRVNLSMMLAGASWAILASTFLTQQRGLKAILIIASLTVLFAQGLTGGRTGYGTWALVGFFLCLFRWRKYILFAPLVAALVVLIVPGVYERMTQGFSSEDVDYGERVADYDERIYSNFLMEDGPDVYKITAGRNIAWPYVIEKIKESPFAGHGRLAMMRTGIAGFLWRDLGESFPHPHNAYLELLLDNGVIGAIPILLFYLLILKYSVSLFMDSRNSAFIAIGGATFALVAALLVASMGSQTFYPREGAVGMWCSIALMLRIYRERKNEENNDQPGTTVWDFPWEGARGKE